MRTNHSLKILLIEDNPGDQVLLKNFLRKAKLDTEKVHVCTRLSEAKKVTSKEPIDLALLDLSLPDCTGISSFRELNQVIPETPIIVLSGLADMSAALETIALGAQDYLVKGEYDEKLLAKSIQYSLERKKIEVKLEESNLRHEIVNKATQDIIFDYTPASGELYLNGTIKEVLGYDPKERDIQWLFSIIHPDDIDDLKKRISLALEHKLHKWEGEYRFRDIHDAYRHAYVRGYNLYDASGLAIRIIGAGTDVSKMKALEQMLAEQQLEHHKSITEHTIQAQEKERSELAKELHDNINQILASVKMFLNIARDDERRRDFLVDRSYENVNLAIEEIRKLSKSLVAPSLGDIGLKEALEELAEEVNLSRRIHLSIDYDEYKENSINSKLQLIIYRIVQEQVNNILKYSKATQARVELKTEPSHIFLNITDNGVGFNPETKAKGIGLKNINNRVEFYSGNVEIISAPEKGCKLQINIPI